MQVAAESWVDQGKKKPAGMKSTLLYTAQSTLSHAPLLRSKKKPAPPVDAQVPVASFVDDVKRKMKLKHVMQHTNEALPGRLETKEDVNYRYAENPERSCGKCTHFLFPGACDMVAGLIRLVDVCNEFEAKNSLARNQASPTVQATFVDSAKKEAEGGPGSGPQKGGGPHAQLQMTQIAKLAPGERRKATHALRRQGLTRHEQSEEGGPGSGRRPGGKTIYAKPEPEGDEDRQIGTFTRREKPGERRDRIKDKKVDPAQAKAIQKALLVVRATLSDEAMSTMGSHVAISDVPGSDSQDYTAPGLKYGRRGAEKEGGPGSGVRGHKTDRPEGGGDKGGGSGASKGDVKDSSILAGKGWKPVAGDKTRWEHPSMPGHTIHSFAGQGGKGWKHVPPGSGRGSNYGNDAASLSKHLSSLNKK